MQNFETEQERIHASALQDKHVILPDEHNRILTSIEKRNLSLSGETTAFMSAGVVLFTSGLGILIYKNIDRIGHMAIIAGMALAVIYGLWVSFRKAPGFSSQKINSPGTGYDYLLLFSNILLLTLLQYISFQTNAFGDTGAHYLLAGAFILFNAYYFDHSGVLAVGIGAIAAFFGIRLNAFGLFDSSVSAIALTATLFAILVELCGVFTERKNIKTHFRFTYVHFSLHLFFVSVIILMSDKYWVALPLLFGFGFFWYSEYAKRVRSFYLLFFSLLYTYILCTVWMVMLVDRIGLYSDLMVYLFLLYVALSGILGISYMKRAHKKLKDDL